MRLIDADALVQALHKADTVMGQPHFLCKTVYGCINKAPTIDAVPVRHGRWIESTTDLICSACETAFNDEIAWMCRDLPYGYPMYCPYCGAKMDGEENEID